MTLTLHKLLAAPLSPPQAYSRDLVLHMSLLVYPEMDDLSIPNLAQ